jgi:hypothetical protein
MQPILLLPLSRPVRVTTIIPATTIPTTMARAKLLILLRRRKMRRTTTGKKLTILD